MAAADTGIPLVTTSDSRLPGENRLNYDMVPTAISEGNKRIVHNQNIMASRIVHNLSRESNGFRQLTTNVRSWSAMCASLSFHLKTRRMRLR